MLLDNRKFWAVVLVFSVATLALAIFLQTGRPIWVIGTIIGHIELVLIGRHLYRTRNREGSIK